MMVIRPQRQFTRRRRARIDAAWQASSAEVNVNVSRKFAYSLWSDRARIPEFMPAVQSVEVDKDDPRSSKWTLVATAFDREWSFSWTARNLTPLPNHKLHWVSEDGVKNKGAVRFTSTRDGGCVARLSIEYECPEALVPFANLLSPVVQKLLDDSLLRFKVYAEEEEEEHAVSSSSSSSFPSASQTGSELEVS